MHGRKLLDLELQVCIPLLLLHVLQRARDVIQIMLRCYSDHAQMLFRSCSDVILSLIEATAGALKIL